MGEFMLFFAKSHAHYSNYQLDYDQMLERIKEILMNNFCAGVITDNEGNWFGSAFFDKEDVKKHRKVRLTLFLQKKNSQINC